MNNCDNLINLTDDLLDQDRDAVAAAILPTLTQSDHTIIDSIHRHLLTLPVLLPFELDQLLDDNDAFLDVIHGLLKANRALDAIPYMSRLNENVMVLSHHYEVYSRAFANTMGLYVEGDGEESSNDNSNNDPPNQASFHSLSAKFKIEQDTGLFGAENDEFNQDSLKGAKNDSTQQSQHQPNNDQFTSLPPNYYAINASALHYTEKQLYRAQDLIALFDLYGVDPEMSEKIRTDHADFLGWIETGGRRLGQVKAFSTRAPILRTQIGGRKRKEAVGGLGDEDGGDDGNDNQSQDDVAAEGSDVEQKPNQISQSKKGPKSKKETKPKKETMKTEPPKGTASRKKANKNKGLAASAPPPVPDFKPEPVERSSTESTPNSSTSTTLRRSNRRGGG